MADTSKTTTITIDPPISANGGKYDTLNLREFTVGERIKSETHTGTNQQFVALIVSVSGWPEAAVRMLPMSAFNEAVSFLAPFLMAGLGTGETSA